MTNRQAVEKVCLVGQGATSSCRLSSCVHPRLFRAERTTTALVRSGYIPLLHHASARDMLPPAMHAPSVLRSRTRRVELQKRIVFRYSNLEVSRSPPTSTSSCCWQNAECSTYRHNCFRVINMSLAVTTPVQHDGYSVFANMLDEIADKHDILFVLPAGNLDGGLARPQWPSTSNDALAMLAGYRYQGQDGIFQPADSIRALVIGALDPKNANGKFVPSRYTRRGPGPALGMKPDLAHVGGMFHQNSGLHSISPTGAGVQSCGTSFSAPLAAKTVAAVDHAIQGGIAREAPSALIIHHAQVPEGLDDPTLKPIAKDFVGHGMPRVAAETLLLDDHEVTMVFNGVLKSGQELRFQFAWPASLVGDNGGCSGKVRLTLVYRPPVDRAFGGEFVRINLDTYLRQEVVNAKTGKVTFEGRLKGDGMKRFEKELVQHGAKWWPVKSLADEFESIGKSSQWRLVIDPLARSNCAVPDGGIPFSAILTIASPDGTTPIFNEMRQQLQNSGAQISDIRTALRPRVR
jgi:hypothetical protein